MTDYGIKIVKPNRSINSVNKRDFILQSEVNALKIFREGSIVIPFTANAASGSKSVLHGLNFTPTFLAYLRVDNKNFLIQQDSNSNDDGDYVGLNGYADRQFLNMTVPVSAFSSRKASNQDFYVYYYIFGDTAREFSNSSPVAGDSYGLKISKPNKSAESRVVEDMIITSQMPSMKIFKQGLTSITGGGTAGVAHGLPFAPAFLVMVSDDNITYQLAFFQPNVSGPYAYGFSDSSTLNFRSTNFPGQTHYFKYIIFANKAGL